MDELSGVRPKLKWDRKKILAFHKEDSNYSDSFLDDILEEEWNVLCDEVTKMMGPVTEWECEVLNFGYRGLEGRKPSMPERADSFYGRCFPIPSVYFMCIPFEMNL